MNFSNVISSNNTIAFLCNTSYFIMVSCISSPFEQMWKVRVKISPRIFSAFKPEFRVRGLESASRDAVAKLFQDVAQFSQRSPNGLIKHLGELVPDFFVSELLINRD